jgi:hypothetical protein
MLTNRVSTHLTNNGAAFPQGVTGIVTYAHSQGFNIGTYVAHSQVFCGGVPGQPTTDEFIYQDVYDIGAMGFDFLKVDACGNVSLYQGLPYAPGDLGSYLTRRNFMFPDANMSMSRAIDRKPLYMDQTETASISTILARGAWHPHFTLSGFNLYENGSPPGTPGVFGGNLTNFIFEMPQFHEHRPGHFWRMDFLGVAAAATAKEGMTLASLAPATVFLPRTNTIGSAALSPFFTNSLVNFGILMHPLCRPGFEVISNGPNHTVVISRPLGPSNGRLTGANGFNGGSFPTGMGGYQTYGTDSTNAVGVFNIDSGAHTQVINVRDIGMASNVWISVYDVWNATSQGAFQNQFTTPSISANDSALYLFYPTSGSNDVTKFLDGTGNYSVPGNTNFTSYASGTAYTLTVTPAQLAFGTTSPSITIQNAGTYTIRAGIGVKYVSATYAGAQTVTLKLRRTNNTPADLTNGGRTVELPVLTTFTGGDVMTTPEIIYTATAGDIVQIFGSISATPSAGSVQTDSAEIVAVRVF